jgi:hypothetical protein
MEKKIQSLWPDDEDVPASKSSVDLTTRVWRRGDLLVMDRHARLPDVCVLTGLPAVHRVERELSFYPTGCHLFLLLGILPYVITILLLTTFAKIELGLCERMFQRQRIQLLFGKILGGVGGAVVVGAIAFGVMTKEIEASIVFIILGSIVGLAGLALGFVGSCLVITHKIDTDYIWLRGVHRNFLDELPEWPGK